MINRRFFIGGFAGFAALGPRCLLASDGKCAGGNPLLRFGVISDVHVAVSGSDWKLSRGYDTDTLLKTLTYFRDQGVDAVVLAGDMAHHGLGPELLKVAEVWFRVFPEDRAPDGRHVERLFITGNHDNGQHRAKRVLREDSLVAANLICRDRAKWWDAAFHEEFLPVWRKSVNGYDFIGCNWMLGDCSGRNEHFNDGIVPFYEKIGGQLDPSKPFFHLQHPILKATAHGEDVWGQDDGRAGSCLARFPNAVAFAGHCHASLLDEKAVWQGAFTACGASTLRNVALSVPGAVKTDDGRDYENYTTPNGRRKELNDLKAMEPGVRDARQGQLVSVYADRIVLSRREFTEDLPLGDDLVLPLGAKDRPFDHGSRFAAAMPPEFPKTAELVVTKAQGTLRRKEKDGGHVVAEVWQLAIPRADAVRNARAVAYEIVARNTAGADERFYLTAYQDFCYGPGDRRRAKPLVMKIAASRLAAEPSFRVRAVSAWGKKSSPLTV